MQLAPRAFFLLFVASSALRVSAQTADPYSLQASGLFTQLGGKAYEGLDPGGGVELQLRCRVGACGYLWGVLAPGKEIEGSAWSIGVGYQLTYHQLSKFQGNELLSGAFIEPRYAIDINSDNVFPYLSTRVTWLRQSLTSGTVSGSASGMTAGLGGGVLLKLSYNVLMDIGATAGYTWFGDFGLLDSNTGVTRTGPAGAGYNIVARFGFALGYRGARSSTKN
jgi:hypothetical protein